jgi:hypothetical protein
VLDGPILNGPLLLAQMADEPPSAPGPGPEVFNPQRRGTAEDVLLDLKPIDSLTINVAPPQGTLPEDHAAARFAREGQLPLVLVGRDWQSSAYLWEAPAFYHGPLYFEEPNLERYGYHFGCWQPAVSAAHFFATVPVLPYKIAAQPCRDCVYSLGYYRPGSPAPLQRTHRPLSLRGATVEGAVVTGLIFLIP